MYFPSYRMRRLRRTPTIRRMLRETTLSVDDLIYPLFVIAGEDVKKPISSMPGCYQLSIGNLLPEVREVAQLGIPAVLLFGIPAHKDSAATTAYDPEGIVQLAVRAIKDEFPELLVITDVCLCEYMDHGHCGVVAGRRGPQRRHAGAAGQDRGLARRSRRRHRRAVRHDGRARRRDPHRARRRGPLRHGDHGVLGEVRLGLLRPVPRGRRVGAGVRRPQDLPDGPAERRGGGPRGAPRHRGGRRHHHGEAGAAVPRRHPRASSRRRSSRSPPTTSAASTRCSRPRPTRAGSTRSAP